MGDRIYPNVLPQNAVLPAITYSDPSEVEGYTLDGPDGLPEVRVQIAVWTNGRTWTVEQTPGGFKVLDASGQALAYVNARENDSDAQIAKVLTTDEARRIAANIAKLPALLSNSKS